MDKKTLREELKKLEDNELWELLKKVKDISPTHHMGLSSYSKTRVRNMIQRADLPERIFQKIEAIQKRMRAIESRKEKLRYEELCEMAGVSVAMAREADASEEVLINLAIEREQKLKAQEEAKRKKAQQEIAGIARKQESEILEAKKQRVPKTKRQGRKAKAGTLVEKKLAEEKKEEERRLKEQIKVLGRIQYFKRNQPYKVKKDDVKQNILSPSLDQMIGVLVKGAPGRLRVYFPHGTSKKDINEKIKKYEVTHSDA